MSPAIYASLKNKAVFITGGATGIGADIVRAFAQQGTRVGFVDILDKAGHELAKECDPSGALVKFEHCDITDIPALEKSVASLAGVLGDFQVLVNNAANDKRMRLDEITPEDWDASLEINLRPQFFAARAVHQGMRNAGGGSIINLSSISWRSGAADMAPYATAKSGIIGLTLALARAYGPDNIRVNAIEPGAVMTEKQRRLWYPDQEKIDQLVNRQLIRRDVLGSDIANSVLFLASDAASKITKQTLTIDAGLL